MFPFREFPDLGIESVSPALTGGVFTTEPPGKPSDILLNNIFQYENCRNLLVGLLALVSLGWEDPLEEEMATKSSVLAWKIPWTEPGGLQSMGSQRVGHDLATKQQQPLFIAMHFECIHFSFNISSPPVMFEIGRRSFKVIIKWYGYRITVVDNNISIALSLIPLWRIQLNGGRKHFRIV